MKYIVETKLPDYDNWYPAIDLDKSKIYPEIKRFNTKEEAETWAQAHQVSMNHEWRVVEDVPE